MYVTVIAQLDICVKQKGSELNQSFLIQALERLYFWKNFGKYSKHSACRLPLFPNQNSPSTLVMKINLISAVKNK